MRTAFHKQFIYNLNFSRVRTVACLEDNTSRNKLVSFCRGRPMIQPCGQSAIRYFLFPSGRTRKTRTSQLPGGRARREACVESDCVGGVRRSNTASASHLTCTPLQIHATGRTFRPLQRGGHGRSRMVWLHNRSVHSPRVLVNADQSRVCQRSDSRSHRITLSPHAWRLHEATNKTPYLTL